MEEPNNIPPQADASQTPPPQPEPTAPTPEQPPRPQINYNTNYNTNYENGQKKKGCLFWGLVVLAAFFTINGLLLFGGLAIIGGIFNSASSLVATDSSYSYSAPDFPYVETLSIEGTIVDGGSGMLSEGAYNHQWTLGEIAALENDPNNYGLLLYINSGGGGTYESEELYQALCHYKETTGRPVYAYYAQTAASGAVYASMAADEIYANRMSTTGSIGVLMSNYNVSGLMEKLGIQDTTITSGKNKTMLSATEPVSAEQEALMQSIIDEYYQIFVGIVSEERNLPMEQVLSFADGRLLSPNQALSVGLIDGICSYDAFLEAMSQKEAFADCEVLYANPPAASVWDQFFSSLPQNQLASGLSLFEETTKAQMRPMYVAP